MPIDPRIALGVQPLQVQYRDPIASYNQLAQLQSADTQNQLAQMQMQEHQQMAPYRLQQAQTQASMSQLTYDQAKQAQDFITTVMSKAREHPEAPENVVEAAQQMMLHGNKQVQDVGAHLLDSYQKVATFKAQLAYGKEAEGAATPNAMASAAAIGGLNDTNASMVVPSAVQTTPAASVAPVGIDQGKGVFAFPVRSSNQIAGEGFNDTIRITPDIRINGKFQQEILDKLKNYGETASLKEFPGMRWSLSPGGLLIREPIPEPAIDNKLALAAQNAPLEVANGLVAKAVPSAQVVPAGLQAAGATPALPAKVGTKTAADLMAEIDAGDKKYAPFGVPIPNWKLKRDILVKQLDEASKRPVMHVVGSNLVGETGNVVYQGTPDMDFKEVVNKDGTTNILAIDKKKGTSTLVMQDGVAVAGVNPAMASAATRMAFDREKFDWEKANPNKTLKEVVQNGVTKYFSVDDRSGVATPVTVAGGKILSGTDTATQRLAFDQAKFAWEKANPGFTIQQTEDGSIVGVNNRTLQAYPVTLNAGKPPANVPFVGVGGGGAPATGVGRGAVGVTDSRAVSGEPAGALETLATVPLKGKGSQPTEGERKAATLLQRLQFSQSQLTDALADDPNAAKPGLFASAVAKLSTPLANTLTPEARQRVQAAQLDMLDAALTLGTGAAYTKEQLEGYRESYFPQIGDKPNQIADKQKRLENVISAAKIAAGRAAQLVPAAPAPAAGGSSAMSAADAIINKGRR